MVTAVPSDCCGRILLHGVLQVCLALAASPLLCRHHGRIQPIWGPQGRPEVHPHRDHYGHHDHVFHLYPLSQHWQGRSAASQPLLNLLPPPPWTHLGWLSRCGWFLTTLRPCSVQPQRDAGQWGPEHSSGAGAWGPSHWIHGFGPGGRAQGRCPGPAWVWGRWPA